MKKNGPTTYNRYAFPSQMTFLSLGLKREELCTENGKIYIVDRCLYEDRFVFAQNSRNQGLLNDNEFEDYTKEFQSIRNSIAPFDAIIYLKASPDQLYERIQKRGREMEKGISLEYLETLQNLYETQMFPAVQKSIDQGKLFTYEITDISPEDLFKRCVKDIKELLKKQNLGNNIEGGEPSI